jgi:hypothetical protein
VGRQKSLPSSNGNQIAIPVQIQRVLRRLIRLGLVIFQNGREDIRYVGLAHDTLLDLLGAPDFEALDFGVEDGCAPKDREQPHEVREAADGPCLVMQRCHEEVRNAVLEHAEALAKRELAHDVEAEEVEPERGIEVGPRVGFDPRQELVGVFADGGLVVS